MPSKNSSASSALPPQPGLQRITTKEVKEALYTDNCIVSTVNYLRNNSRNVAHTPGFRTILAATNYSTVVQNLIELMKTKGYPQITMPNVVLLYNYLFMPEVDRKDIFNCMYKWANMGPCPIAAKKMRSLLTFSGSSLATATQESVESSSEDYFKTWSDIPGAEKKLTDGAEFNYFKLVLAKKKGITIKKGVKPDVVKKKVCSDCWLCGTPVYIFKYKTTILSACGEDEHVLPPGIGNLSGLLEPTYKATIKHFHDSILIQKGLRASHTWCNQTKSDFNFIKPPLVGKGTAKGWSLNREGIDKFLEAARQRLNPKSPKAPKDYLYSYESMFARNQSEAAKNSIIAGMKNSIETHIKDVCKEANKLVIPQSVIDKNNNTIYTACIIRLIFNTCFIGKEYIFKNFGKKWKSFTKGGGGKGGEGPEGPEELDSDFLSILCKEIMNEGGEYSIDTDITTKFDTNYDDEDDAAPDVFDDTVVNELTYNEAEITSAFDSMDEALSTEFRDGGINTVREDKIGIPDQQFIEDYPVLYDEMNSIINFIDYDIQEEPVDLLKDVPPEEINKVVWDVDKEGMIELKSKYFFRDTPERARRVSAQAAYEAEKDRLISTSGLTEDETQKLIAKINRNKSSIRGIKMNITALKNSRELNPVTDTDIEIVIQPGGTKSNKRKQLKTRNNKQKKTRNNKRKKTGNNKRKKTRRQRRN
jgi:hypothetical protein